MNGEAQPGPTEAARHVVALRPGYALGRYGIEGVLGQGSFGITYRARDLDLGRTIAIKEYLPLGIAVRVDGTVIRPKTGSDRESFDWGLARFVEEARALALFDEALSIVQVHDYFQANGTAYMVMALVEGEPLSAHFRSDQRRVALDLPGILLPLLSGLEQVHKAGFLHRDIKPSNILLRGNGFPVLIDFGAARQALGERSRSITSVFTPGYAPFEQYMSNGHQGPWTDIYALAATMYQGIAGSVPAPAPDRMRRDEMVPAIEAGAGRYSRPFLAAIDRGLAVFEDARPQSVGEWRALLLAEEVQPARIARPTGRWRLALAAGLGTVLAAGGSYAVWSEFERERLALSDAVKAEGEIRSKAEESAREQAQRAAALRQQEEERRIAAERQAREEAEARRRAEEEERRQAAEAQARAEAERQRQEAAAKAVAEAKAKAEAEAKAKAEADKTKAEAEVKKKAEEEVKRKAEAEAKARAEQEAQRTAQAAAATQQAATPAFALAGTWTLIIDCPNTVQRPWLTLPLTISTPNFSARFGLTGIINGQISEKSVQAKLSIPGGSEPISGTINANARGDGEFRGNAALTGFRGNITDQYCSTQLRRS